MARTRGRRRKGKESVSGYFRKIFMQRPELLDSTSNEELVERWKADHETNNVPISVRANLANLKSHLRKRRRLGLSLGRPVDTATATVRPTRSATNGLEALEEHIRKYRTCVFAGQARARLAALPSNVTVPIARAKPEPLLGL